MAKKIREYIHLEILGRSIPARIFHESRANVRASIRKQSIILRMPLELNPSERAKHLTWLKDWVKEEFSKRPDLFKAFEAKDYECEPELLVGKRKYEIRTERSSRRSLQATLKNGIIFLKLPIDYQIKAGDLSIKYLIGGVVGKDFLPEITEKVNQLNEKHFQKSIQSINIRYNKSRWGSCSSKGKLAFSARLLMAPDPVIDYVIIHELTHLEYFNHSPAFWGRINEVMPEYKKHELWLKKHGNELDF